MLSFFASTEDCPFLLEEEEVWYRRQLADISSVSAVDGVPTVLLTAFRLLAGVFHGDYTDSST